jgi:hypothetical protein
MIPHEKACAICGRGLRFYRLDMEPRVPPPDQVYCRAHEPRRTS